MCHSSLELVTVGKGLAGAQRADTPGAGLLGADSQPLPAPPSCLLPHYWQTRKSCVRPLRKKLQRMVPLAGRISDSSLTEGCPVTVPGVPPHSPHQPWVRSWEGPHAQRLLPTFFQTGAYLERGDNHVRLASQAPVTGAAALTWQAPGRGWHPFCDWLRSQAHGPPGPGRVLSRKQASRLRWAPENRGQGCPSFLGGDGDMGAQVTPPAAVPLACSSRKGQRFLVVPESPLPAHLSARPTCQGRAGERGAHEHGPDLQGRSAGVRGLRPEQVATQAAEWKAYGCRSHPWSPTGLRVPVKSQDARRSGVASAPAAPSVAEGGLCSGA